MLEGALFTITNLLGSTAEQQEVPGYFLFLIPLLFAISCYTLAKKLGRNPIIWAGLGLIFNLIALIALAFSAKKETAKSNPIKETTGNGVMHNDGAAAINDDSFEMPKAPRISSSKSLNWHYINSDNEIKGPFSLNDLRKEIHTNKLDSTTYIWCDEFEEWTQITEFSNASLLLDSDFIE
ncbi:DUF4339 domain-containing protein [bacterium]|nr:DUF4339 domain-containing protein [bacterium]